MIAILKNVYYPDIQGKSAVTFVHTENDQNINYFDSIEEAVEEKEKLESETYLLSNNEAGRPEYYIVNDNVGDYILSGRNYDMSNYNWNDANCDCGECFKCFQMMIDQDRSYIKSFGNC